jgi:hypothetical protein
MVRVTLTSGAVTVHQCLQVPVATSITAGSPDITLVAGYRCDSPPDCGGRPQATTDVRITCWCQREVTDVPPNRGLAPAPACWRAIRTPTPWSQRSLSILD